MISRLSGVLCVVAWLGGCATDVAPQQEAPRHRGVALQHPEPAPQTATPVCKNPKVAYFGGPVLQSPIVVPVFWSTNVNSTLQSNVAQFYTDIMASSYWQVLAEYGSVGLAPSSEQAILAGTVHSPVTISPQKCNPGGASCKVADTDIQAELVRQIGLGALPAPTVDCTGNVNTVYMIDFAPNVQVNAFGERSCGGGFSFCGYHNTGTIGTAKTPLVYGVLMDTFSGGCATGCGGGKTGLDNATSLASHELSEAVTDPDIGLDTAAGYALPAGWGDNNNGCGEIGDICDDGTGDTITVGANKWYVQEEWSNKANKCLSTAAAVPICDGTTTSGCRKCSCGDDGLSCTGATAICETMTTNVLFGACEACTAATGCTGGETCQQSKTPAQDDICTGTCMPLTTCPVGDDCGTISDGCTSTVTCGTNGGACAVGTCVANHCVQIDAGVPDAARIDAVPGTPDAPPAPDAAPPPPPDASTPDAARPDASPANPDATPGTPDATPGAPDGTPATPDATPGSPDARSSTADATSPGSPDAAPGGDKHGGCGCHVGQSGPRPSTPPLALLALVPLVAVRRRRRRP